MSHASPADQPASSSHLLLDTETRLRLIEENVTDFAIIGVDEGGRIVSWNVGAERILGYTQAEAVGRSLSLLFTPEDQQEGVSGRLPGGSAGPRRLEPGRDAG